MNQDNELKYIKSLDDKIKTSVFLDLNIERIL